MRESDAAVRDRLVGQEQVVATGRCADITTTGDFVDEASHRVLAVAGATDLLGTEARENPQTQTDPTTPELWPIAPLGASLRLNDGTLGTFTPLLLNWERRRRSRGNARDPTPPRVAGPRKGAPTRI
jgi:hypothetical protein